MVAQVRSLVGADSGNGLAKLKEGERICNSKASLSAACTGPE
jgi:hypothetical protein